jgi:hypothetical protein
MLPVVTTDFDGKLNLERRRSMVNHNTVRRTNFTCFHAGPKEEWTQFRLDPPDVPLPAKGKLFLRSLLMSAGLEMSLNVVPPGKGIPSYTNTNRMTRFTSSSVAEGNSLWVTSASTWQKARFSGSAHQRHELGGITPIRRCISCASSTELTA